MRKTLLAAALMLLTSAASYAQTTKLDRVKARLESEGYQSTSDNGSNYADLKQGENGYVTKTFYKGDSYKLVAFSDDADVRNMDIILEDEDGNVIVRDYTKTAQCEVTYTPTRDIELKVKYKNTSSGAPNYESRCRMLITYLSGGAAALLNGNSGGTSGSSSSSSSSSSSGSLDLDKIDNNLGSGKTDEHSARYDEVKQYLADRNYSLSVTSGDGYADLAQGEVGYVWKEFYKGDEYLIVTFSDEAGVKDMDLFLEDDNGTTIKKDADASNMAVVKYVPTENIKLKVRYKNTRSTKSGESRCRLFIAYKGSGG